MNTPLYLNTTAPDFSDCNPAEEALLREEVAATLVADPSTAIQVAVSTGRHIYKQDWKQEARKLLHEFGLPVTCFAPMALASTCKSA